MSRAKIAVIVVVAIALLLVGIGVLATDHSNPLATYTINWDSPTTERLARAACFDCHSHETVWPWYSYIAPVSFLIAKDVADGRAEMNFSTGRGLDADEMIEQIERGKMPKPIYLPLHPEANLSNADKAALIAGLRATFGSGSDRNAPIQTPEDHERDENDDEKDAEDDEDEESSDED